MAFEKAFDNNYHDLDQDTKYRFAEIEIGRAIQHLTAIFHPALTPRQQATQVIFDAIAPKHLQYEETESAWHDAMNTTTINLPPKNELIAYFIAHGQSYQKIRNFTSASFNTISAARYGIPQFYPTFNRWDPEMLINWNTLKATLNLWNEPLVHNH